MLKLEIRPQNVEIRNKDVVAGINALSDKDRLIIIEGITKIDTVTKQKWSFVTSSRLLMKKQLTESELFEMLSVCYDLTKNLKTKLKKML